MKLSWNSLKISIAGAKLTHLVKKDQAWDHGTMIEQVKIIFQLLQKVKSKGESQLIKKYMTISGYEKLKKNMEVIQLTDHIQMTGDIELTDVAIIEVHEGTFTKPDNFSAQVKGRDASQLTGSKNHGAHDFIEEWFFIRQGEWWLLDDIKIKKSLLKN
jgi:hypothetical protein